MRSARLAFALALLAACGPSPTAPVAYPVPPDELPDEQQVLAGVDQSMGFRDAFRPIRDGRFVPWRDAPRMAPGERVIGLDLGTAAFAYPIQYLNFVEIVEHTADGQELLVCW